MVNSKKINFYFRKTIMGLNHKTTAEALRPFWFKYLKYYLECLYDLSKKANGEKKNKKSNYRKLVMVNQALINRIVELEKVINKKYALDKTKKAFRIVASQLIYQSIILKRAFKKPLGYPGDWKLLEMIYDNKPISNKFGCLIDQYFLDNPYAKAVRNRKNITKYMLSNFIKNEPEKMIHILNVACGSSREIREMLKIYPEVSMRKNIYLSLVDQDKTALDFSKKEINKMAPGLKVITHQNNILEYLLREDKYKYKLGKQDCIYCIGLLDYLPDRLLQKTVKFLFSLLKNRGSLILAHKDTAIYNPVELDWWCDWRFFQRNKQRFISLIRDSGIKDYSIKLMRENSKIIFFVTIIKKA